MPLLTFPNPHEMALSIRATALVFEDSRSNELLERIRLVAPSEANVLIIGETGTGKELTARHVHELSRRRKGPFIAVNCGALTDSLVESELFGHEKGAFTGALSSRAGWFEEANGGTLFLDEIGDLPLATQVKLLRVLQEREVVPVGSRQARPINVRLIAATNVRLEEAVEAGRFRGDLFFRLNVAILELLPLRKRPGDIMPLVKHFLKTYGNRLGAPDIGISPSAERALLLHPWPGNIRELENVVHHAVLVCRNDEIDVNHLHLSRLESGSGFCARKDSDSDPFEQALLAFFEEGTPDLYARIEHLIMRAAYHYCHNNQLQTARLLGISRNVVRARLLQYGELPSGSARSDASPGPD
ncbi:sigma-54 dependent transcriptional regulator [Candidatus Methylospira mobilis]|uniref:sigma-54 interaction domain-containing protein n=1 Tax=Candidatus Methylospira mobilis TaxID=1808979 RepID=UPI0028E61CF0|nr:sigma-54 dependent transcriptional regulator [Candidatus Methylospira mobilis]WNV04760.1 sigma-54 dependent transcriptional regulator [Candidatus Methylospira mobilis]